MVRSKAGVTMIKAIIFDMDGTLVDTEPFNTEIEKRQFSLNKIPVSSEEHQQYLGTASDVMWHEIVLKHRIQIPAEDLIEQNRSESIRFFSEVEKIPVMPGLVQLLEILLKKNYLLAVASSSIPEIIELVLTKTDLKKYFRIIVSTQETGKSKPEPDVFLLTAKRLGINPENCLVIEDSANGIKAAHAANMSCIAYQSPGINPKSQKDADAVITSFAQLETMLD